MTRSPFRNFAPSLHRLRAVYSYDPESGVFRLWKGRGGRSAGKVAGTLANTGYRIITLDGIRYPAHRLAWFYVHGFWPPAYIDHVNRDRSDNRICNLRLATQSQNNINSDIRSDNSLGHKGVVFDAARKRYRAYIVVDGKQKYLGRYLEFKAACAAYEKAASDLYGEFALPVTRKRAISYRVAAQ